MPETEITDEQVIVSFDTEDEFNRKPVAEKLIRLLTSDIDVSPMVIDGGWGAGKTRFCEKTINLFKELHPDYRCIYVDAFKADHADEPLMTLLAAVAEALPKPKQKQLIKKAIPAARFALKTGLKAGVGWVLRQSADQIADDFEKDVERAGKAVVDASIESLLKDHIDAKESIETLRTALEELAMKQPIVIFVDELDRCRPDFAVSMLENIKHIFDVEGVDFVLVTNTDQLRASINHCYGTAVDSQRYLDKFIGFSFKLPEKFGQSIHNMTLAAERHYYGLVREDTVLATSCLAESGSMDFANELISANNLSLREIETWVRYLAIYHLLTNKEGLAQTKIFGYKLLRIFGVYLFCFDPTAKAQILRNRYDASQLLPHTGKSQIHDLGEGHYGEHLDAIAALISLEASDVPVSMRIEGDEQIEQWKLHINEYFRFRGGFRRNGGDGHLGAVGEVIHALTLNGAQ